MKHETSGPNKTDGTLSRRRVIGLLGLGAIALQFPYACASDKSKTASPEAGPLYYLTLTEIAEMIRSKKISSLELTRMMLDRIATVDQKLNSYITVMGEYALVKASAMDKELEAGQYRGPLHGVPIGIKDLLFTTQAPTTGGHSFKSDFIAPYNATVVDRLENAGAVILGKLNLTEGAMGGYSSAFKIPKNPWGEDLWTGVSSSGSGVATAAGLCFGSIGSDTGGSIRFPSIANGIVGLKPTYGLVSRYGVMPLAESFDHVGPMTRSTLDAAVMLEAIGGFDANDPTSLPGDSPKIMATIKDGMKGLKIGVDLDYIRNGVDPALATSIENAVKKMEELGAIVTPFKMTANEKERGDAWFIICTKEAYEANKNTYPSRKAEYGNYFADLLEMGSRVTEDQYNQARKFHEEFKASFRQLLSTVDAFVAPAGGMAKGVTETMWRAKMSEDVISNFNDQLDLQFGSPADMAGIPALTLPCGKAENGMPPPGFQLMGGPLTESILCKIGYAYEQATGWSKQHPNV